VLLLSDLFNSVSAKSRPTENESHKSVVIGGDFFKLPFQLLLCLPGKLQPLFCLCQILLDVMV
jgi:hypothetical protein